MKKIAYLLSALLTVLLFSGQAQASEPIDFAALKVGDVIKLGHYEQDGDETNGPEAIEWQIVFVKGKKILALAKDNIELYDFQPDYKVPSVAIQEAALTLLSWTKKDFSKKAFTKEEKAHVKASFVMSKKDVEKMVPAEFRAAKPSPLVLKKGAEVGEGGNCRWWLDKDTNPYSGHHNLVDASGNFGAEVLFKNKVSAIRPAIWLKP